jgi:adenosylmethionine-8-amino-7-oxononanoate aminotransferase
MSPPALLNDGNVVETTTKPTNAKQESSVLHRNLKFQPHTIVSAEGVYITLSNGQRILDASGGAAVASIGHGNPRIKAAIAKQMDIVSYCATMFYSTSAAEELAEELRRGTGGEMTKVFIVSSGESYR